MINYKIVAITESHIEQFWQAVDSVAREQKYLAFLEAPSINTTIDFVRRNIEENWPHFVAVDNNKVIGWADITSLDRPVFSHSGTLGIGVLAPYRGQGIGKALLSAALLKAKSKGLTRIELTVRENNKTAIMLYQQFGFVIEGFHKNAVKINEVYENHISMALIQS